MLKSRVESRLNALGLNQFEVVEGSELSRHFVYDILAGKKKSIRGKNATTLARLLKCSVEFLTGESDDIGSPPNEAPQVTRMRPIPAAGIIDEQSWRLQNADPISMPSFAPLLRYADSKQMMYWVQGEAFEHIKPGMFVIGVASDDYVRNHGAIGPGSTVIVQKMRLMDGKKFTQNAIRKLSNSSTDRALVRRLEQSRPGHDDSGDADSERIVAVPVLAMTEI